MDILLLIWIDDLVVASKIAKQYYISCSFHGGIQINNTIKNNLKWVWNDTNYFGLKAPNQKSIMKKHSIIHAYGNIRDAIS